jgi:hypothetical protein
VIERAFVQEEGMGRLLREMREARDSLVARGIDVTLFTRKRMDRRQLAITPATLVVGEIPVVETALKQLGIDPPGDDSYPEALRPYLLRRVWQSTVGDVESRFVEGDGHAVFVKPRDRLKRFTGFVAEDTSSLARLASISRRAEVWCAAVVAFRSEHRAYVVDGDVLGVHPYTGDPTLVPDRRVIDEVVAAWTKTGLGARGYGIDFGVLEDGRTALVELNDGYGLGNYGLSSDDYLSLCLARWQQLVTT